MDYASCVKVKPGGARERSVVVLGLAWIRATGAGGHVGVVHTNELLTERKTPARTGGRLTRHTRVAPVSESETLPLHITPQTPGSDSRWLLGRNDTSLHSHLDPVGIFLFYHAFALRVGGRSKRE